VSRAKQELEDALGSGHSERAQSDGRRSARTYLKSIQRELRGKVMRPEQEVRTRARILTE
jgi:hypothetical protein